MSVQFEHGVYLDQSPERVFALLDDVEKTPSWLKSCTGMKKLTEGDNQVGTKLKYSYKEGSKTGEMAGRITVRAPNERFAIVFTDKTRDLTWDYRISNTGAGSHVVHTISITPKTFMSKIFGPGQGNVQEQTITAMNSLRSFLARE